MWSGRLTGCVSRATDNGVIDPARLAAFAALTAMTSLVPGPNMLFVFSQAAWSRARGGLTALAGLQLGNAMWFVLAGLGLGGLARAWPMAFHLLALGGAVYLAWLGVQAWRHSAGAGDPDIAEGPPRRKSRHPFRDGIVVAAGNPKSLVYVVALLPPFVDPRLPVAPQLVLLGAVAIGFDVVAGLVYLAAGNGLASALSRPLVRQRLERAIGCLFLALAAAIVVRLLVES